MSRLRWKSKVVKLKASTLTNGNLAVNQRIYFSSEEGEIILRLGTGFYNVKDYKDI